MKRLYYRSAGPSPLALLGSAALALGLLLLLEAAPLRTRPADHEARLRAARLAEQAFDALREERLLRGIPIERSLDPAGVGLIGAAATEVTTSAGALPVKQLTQNPNFAALLVDYLHRAGVRPGDAVAVGYSGSFPALNVCVLAAIRSTGAETLSIASATSSDYGATWPGFLWVDMERSLQRRGLFRTTSLAASLGGVEDQGLGMSAASKRKVLSALERNQLPLLESTSFKESIDQRMALYDRAAGGRRIGAYVNVGGGAVSVGRSRGKSFYPAGLIRPGLSAPVDSVLGRFLERGVPAVHLVRITELAAAHGLPEKPRARVPVGQGALYGRVEPRRWLAALCLLALSLWLGVLGYRTRLAARKSSPETP